MFQSLNRRSLLQSLGLGALLALVPGCSNREAAAPLAADSANSPAANSVATASTQEDPGTIQIGYWPVASGLPLFVAVEKGYFKDAGLKVEAARFASPQQVAEGLIAGRLQGSDNGTASGALALAELAQPGLFRIIASNPSNIDMKLDEIIVAKNSPIKSVRDLKGKIFASGPGPQNVAIAEGILEANGITGQRVQQLEIKQHAASIAAGQIDAAYTLEPTGTIGADLGLTRVLEYGVVSKYVLGNPKALWFGGSATLSSEFITKYPATTKKFIAAYRRAIEEIRRDPQDVRRYLAGYTAIKGNIAQKVPLVSYKMYDEMSASDLADFQKFFDFMTRKKVFKGKVEVAPLIYKPQS